MFEGEKRRSECFITRSWANSSDDHILPFESLSSPFRCFIRQRSVAGTAEPSLNLHSTARPASSLLQVLLIRSAPAGDFRHTRRFHSGALPIKANDLVGLMSWNAV